MVKNPRDIILAPVVSEKTYDLIEHNNTYTFEVDRRANKTEIKEAIKSIFEVSVDSVNTINRKGKSKGVYFTRGKRRDSKKAYVTLAAGDTIDIFGV